MPVGYEETESAGREIAKGPHCWIQWKGTQVCMDVHCSCGEHTHIDADFVYNLKCGACGKWYHVCPYVILVPASDADSKELEDEPYCVAASHVFGSGKSGGGQT